MSPEQSDKASRRYRSPRRARAAADTRATILTTAMRLFVEHGYGNVTIGDIAREASTAAPTVYASTGGKAAILAKLIGDAIKDPIVNTTVSAIRESSTPHDAIRVTAHGTRVDNERHRDMVEIMISAAAIDEAARATLVQSNRIYWEALAHTADRLQDMRAVKPGIDRGRATDILYFYFGHQAWRVCVAERGWSWDDAEQWLADQAGTALLE
jgi:AcrR family transcriptional regulator